VARHGLVREQPSRGVTSTVLRVAVDAALEWALACGAVAAVAVTGGVALAAIAEGGFVVVVGDTMVAAGPAALALVATV